MKNIIFAIEMCLKVITMLFIPCLVVKRKIYILLSTLFFGVINFTSFAQITLSFPTNRIVFQRNNDNVGFINIMGNYSQPVDRIEARLTPVQAGQGTATDWTVISQNPKAGYFSGVLQGKGGWYKMEVRGIKNNVVLRTLAIEKVGIGEVFIALGQSNAEGLPDSGAKGAQEDRVNTVNFYNSDVLDPLPENLNFVQMSQDVDIAPYGRLWCYGELGDRLVRKLNVPVMFFNCGELIVSVINWRESAEGLPTYIFEGTYLLPKGLPYMNLKNTLHYYGSLLGVRSLLWIQGETDNYPNKLSAQAYSSNLQRLIDIARRDFNNDLSWMVARTSLTYLTPSNPEIIRGQNIIIERGGNNVFPGPFTDDLQIPRPDGVHFKNVPGSDGLSILAENWDKYLDDNFFKNSKPILSKPIADISIACNSNNESVLTLPEGFGSYNWSNNSNSRQITVGRGVFTATVTDAQRNKILVPMVNTNLIYPVTKPKITAASGLEFCANEKTGVELEVTATEPFKSFMWNTGSTSAKITATTTGTFSVKGFNDFGCASENSDNVSVKVNPAPAKPQIAVSPESLVCEGKSITLSVDSNDNILWSNNTTAKTIQVDKVGDYSFTVKVTNAFGCIENSDQKSVSIKATPRAPEIGQVGIFTLQAQSSDSLSSDKYEWKQENSVIATTENPILKVQQDGFYRVSVLRNYTIDTNKTLTCTSNSSGVFFLKTVADLLVLYPNPVSDVIYLETKGIIKNVDILFYNLIGQLIHTEHYNDTSERKGINIRFLENGSYIVKIKSNEIETTKRIIIANK